MPRRGLAERKLQTGRYAEAPVLWLRGFVVGSLFAPSQALHSGHYRAFAATLDDLGGSEMRRITRLIG